MVIREHDIVFLQLTKDFLWHTMDEIAGIS